jgi:uncharacterized membrane protein
MTARRALLVILVIGLCGLVFSGYLSYQEFFNPTALSCPSPGEPGTILGWPACVYGFFMYLMVVSAALWGLLATSGDSAAQHP